jgi:uncharacterized cupin superfamily protein
MYGVLLSDAVGLQRVGVFVIRVPPGKESFIYHKHTCEEEFLFILSGSGVAEIDGAEYEVGVGDFMGFPTPSVGHHLRNPFEEDLIYLVAGERKEVEFAEFPQMGKHIFRTGPGRAYLVDTDKLELLGRKKE